jgi:ABC-type transporter Mla subunit MlaD
MALTPLVAKLKEGMDMLGAFYDKLGPIQGALEWVGEGVHNVAESFRDTKPPIEEVEKALEALEKEGPNAPKAVADAWALAIKDFQDGAGTYKDAIGGIEEQISVLTEEWMTATDKRKDAIDKEMKVLEDEKGTLEDLKKATEDHFNSTEEATQKMKEFTVAIGDTTVSFKGAAAEVVKNADAYEKLQNSAQKLMDLDWSVFTEFEASLPNIEAGIGDMESSFVGLKDVLEDNIGSLETVQESVMDISEIAAPFLEAGFLEGIESIGNFAGALSDACGAINTFANLQDVSIEGCIDFSLHVHDMVSALEILESQMEDLVPSFADMDSLITDIADAFLYSGPKAEVFASEFDAAMNAGYKAAEKTSFTFDEFSGIVEKAMDVGYITVWMEELEKWHTFTVTGVSNVQVAIASAQRTTGELITTDTAFFRLNEKGWRDVSLATENYGKITGDVYGIMDGGLSTLIKRTYNFRLSTNQLYELMAKPPEEQKEWLDDLQHSESVLTFQMDKQTNALKSQTGQLSKITEALQPYLGFMRTLNELAALSTLSTEELNNGLNSINDTLVNLGSALSTFDLRPVMESLFGTKITEGEDIGKFTGGIAKGFTEVITAYQGEFGMLIEYISRLSFAISSLVNSFEALANISDSVLADQKKLKEVFEGITDVMANFSMEMGGAEGFAQKIADGMEAMLKSAAPLIKYFQDNNAAVEQFNKALSSFRGTITNLIGVFEDLSSLVKASSEVIVIFAEDIEEALSLVDDQLEQIALYLGSDAWGEIATQLGAVSKEWEKWAIDVDNSMPAFNSAVDTFSTLLSKIVGLSAALKDMRDMSVLSVRDIDEALKDIPVFLDRFVDALALNMDTIKGSLKELHIEWGKHADEMVDTMPSFTTATKDLGDLIGTILSLNSALDELRSMGIIREREFNRGFERLTKSIANFAVSLAKNVDGLISSLQHLNRVWIANQSSLVPLMRAFMRITANFYKVANNANAMAGAFRDLQKNSGSLEKGFSALIKFINQVVEGTKKFYTPEAAAELASYITDVGKVIAAFVDLERELEDAMGTIKKAIGAAVDNIEGKLSSLSNLVKSAYGWGADIMDAFITGIDSMSDTLELAVTHQAGIVEEYLGASSPTKLGPLSHLDEWPRNLIQSYSTGIEREMHTLNTSFAGMVAGPAAGGGGNRNVNFYVTQHISDKSTADYANRDLERLMHKHAVM